MRPAILVVVALIVAGCGGPSNDTPPTSTSTASGGGPPVRLVTILAGLNQPVFVTEEPSLAILFVVEQPGRVLLTWRDDPGDPQVFLDITAQVKSGGEQGLLGFAFHPDFGKGDQRFYVHFSDLQGDTQVDEYEVLGTPGAADAVPLKTRSLLHVDQPYSNHNGGMLTFGPDRMLYLGLGDGGSGGDPRGNGQNKDVLLGKILRIDVGSPDDAHSGKPYGIPSDNPFAHGGGRGEIWDYGLRNPWRFSFDRTTGDLWIGDVGQDDWEEVDFETAARGGNNFGWNAREGKHGYDAGTSAPGAVDPVAEYDHGGGRCSITGGYRYRGADIPGLVGMYLYADVCTGTLYGLLADGDGWQPEVLSETGLYVSSFGEDARGELYMVDLGGAIYRIMPPA